MAGRPTRCCRCSRTARRARGSSRPKRSAGWPTGRPIPALVQMLADNNDRDANLRHAGSLALSRIGDASPVAALSRHGSRAVRIAAIVALRRMRHPDVARFLTDADEQVVTEAARAINDDGAIEAALPALARVLEERRFTSEPLLRRAINANLRLGTSEAPTRLTAFAADASRPAAMRAEAAAALAVWSRPRRSTASTGRRSNNVRRGTFHVFW